jgi:type IV pilus assembly protein PilB
MALHEVMPITEEIQRLTVARSSTDEVARAAHTAGMVPLRRDGWLKVAQGETSIEEVLRVVV